VHAEIRHGVKAVLFDAGNTLVWLDHAFLVQLLADHGVQTTEAALMDAEYGAKRRLDALVRDGRAGDDASRAAIFFGEVFRTVGIRDASFPALSRRLFARHREKNLWSTVREHTAATLQLLRDRGYSLAVVSNADGRVEALLDTLGLGGYFDCVIDSGVVGVEKPDPRIFRMACERLDVAPEESVYVGDIYEIDVVGARGAGLRAFLMDPLDRWAELDCECIRGLDDLPDRLAEATA
jgi:putative hydrolase of the HAD superfamily